MVEVTDTITAQSRTAQTKGHARKLRASGHVPAVAYGPGAAPRHLALDPKMFVMQRQRYGLSHIYDVKLADGEGFKCVIKEIQVDPMTRKLLHVDLYAVDMTRPIRVVVPIEMTGKPKGLIDGGLLSQILRSAEVLCLPDAVPAKLVADVSNLGVGDSLHLMDIVLPNGCKLTAQNNEAVALVAEPEEAPAPTAAEAAAAAPGAAAAAPAAKSGDKK
jgi:large subunit ribosomal protein L25